MYIYWFPAEGLHLIDFEQLKIENQSLNEKIEERNEELVKLRKKTTVTVQVSADAWTGTDLPILALTRTAEVKEGMPCTACCTSQPPLGSPQESVYLRSPHRVSQKLFLQVGCIGCACFVSIKFARAIRQGVG